MVRQLGDAAAHRFDDLPPARQRAERDRDITAERDPVRDMELAAEIAGRIKEHGDDPHRLLRVVQPVADRIGGRGNQVETAKAFLRENGGRAAQRPAAERSEAHTSALQTLMRISYAVFCLKKKN